MLWWRRKAFAEALKDNSLLVYRVLQKKWNYFFRAILWYYGIEVLLNSTSIPVNKVRAYVLFCNLYVLQQKGEALMDEGFLCRPLPLNPTTRADFSWLNNPLMTIYMTLMMIIDRSCLYPTVKAKFSWRTKTSKETKR